MKYQFELTDTFGGEANYAWVRRTVVELPIGTSDKLLGMLAREWAGFTGKACTTENYGDAMIIRPRGMAQVLHVTDLIGGEPEISAKDVEAWAIGVRHALAGEYASLVSPRERELSAGALGAMLDTVDAAASYLAHIGAQGESVRRGLQKLRELAADPDLAGGRWLVSVENTASFDESLDTDGDLGYAEESVQMRALGGMVSVGWWPAK